MKMTAEDLAFLKGQLCDKSSLSAKTNTLSLAEQNGYVTADHLRGVFVLGCLNDLSTETSKESKEGREA